MPRSSTAAGTTGRRSGALMALVIVLAMVSAAQQPGESPESVLRRTRERIIADLERFPRYTCVQTITRHYYRPRSGGAACSVLMAERQNKPPKQVLLRGWDRLRLEVAVTARENVYSWVGAPRFESGMIEQIAGRGPFNTGDFGPYLGSIFTQARLSFEGEQSSGDTRLLAYSYDVPLSASSYQVKDGDRWTPTAYNGILLLDPASADIAQLKVNTAELPETNPDCQAISEVEYGRTEIHGRPVLIPRRTSLITIGRDGSETESNTTYSSCREYASRTRMLIDPQSVSSTAGSIDRAAGVAVGSAPPAAGSSSPASAPPLAEVPAGLHFHLNIITPIDSDTAAAGDPIEGVLRSPLRQGNNLLAPAGTRVHGRLRRMERFLGTYDHFLWAIELESIDLNGRPVPLRAAPDPSLVAMRAMTGLLVALDADTKEHVFMIRKEHLLLKKIDWNWTTLPLPETGKEQREHPSGTN